jgi:outer membrane protein assembly factor BamB
MLNSFKTVLTVVGVLAMASTARAEEPVGHRMVVHANGHVMILNAKGETEWQVDMPFTSHDIQMLPNGNLLIQNSITTVVEMTPKKEIVWKHESKPIASNPGDVQIHAFQRLKNGTTMISETGNSRIIEVDKEDKIVHEIPVTFDTPPVHSDTRRVRRLDNGHYLAGHEGRGIIREYDQNGKVVWTYKVDLAGRERAPGGDGHGAEPFGALRLKNGNTLIAGGNNNRVLEVNKAGEIVWSIDRDELPGIHLCWVTSLQVLPNGNIIIGNTHAGPDNPQLIEISHDKKVVWTYKNFAVVGNNLCGSQVLDVKGKFLH